MNDGRRHNLSVTFCITELDVGGAENALVRIAIGLQEGGWQVRVISLRDAGPLAQKLEKAGIPVTALNCGSFADIRTYFRLRSELKRHPPNVLMCFLHQANIYGRLAARFKNGPVVVSGIRVADRRKSVIFTERLTHCCTAHYIAVSQHVAETHADICGIPRDRVSSIPNGVELGPAVQEISPAGRSDNVLLFVGRLTEQKDPLGLLAAFAQLPEDLQAKTRLQFVGEGPLRRPLEDEIRRLGLGQQVEVPGQSDRIPELMRQAALLVLPSRWEGMPNVVLEAMANGLPVVASDVDGVKELITEGRNGWLVPAGDPAALALTLREALEAPELRASFAESSQVLISESLTWNSVIQNYDQTLSRLASTN